MREELWSITYLSNFEYRYPFCRYLPLKFEVVQYRAKFCMFLAQGAREIFMRGITKYFGPGLYNQTSFQP